MSPLHWRNWRAAGIVIATIVAGMLAWAMWGPALLGQYRVFTNVHDLRVNGQITTEAGLPVTDALVAARCWERDWDDFRFDTRFAATDQSGRYSVEFPHCMQVTIVAHAPGRLGAWTGLSARRLMDASFVLPTYTESADVETFRGGLRVSPPPKRFAAELSDAPTEGFDASASRITQDPDEIDIHVVRMDSGRCTLRAGPGAGLAPVYRQDYGHYFPLALPVAAPPSGYLSEIVGTEDLTGAFINTKERLFARVDFVVVGGLDMAKCDHISLQFDAVVNRTGARTLSYQPDKFDANLLMRRPEALNLYVSEPPFDDDPR